MRRAIALLSLAALVVVQTGCSGADAREAQELLAQSDAAFAQVKSTTFTARISVTGGPQEFAMTMKGGAIREGNARAISTWLPPRRIFPSGS
jgi:hypothetical protein